MSDSDEILDQRERDLIDAVESGDTEKVTRLLDQVEQDGKSVSFYADAQDPDSKQTLLIMAAIRSDYDMVKLLLARGALPSTVDCLLKTALDHAIEWHSDECVNALLEAGANTPSCRRMPNLMEDVGRLKKATVQRLQENYEECTYEKLDWPTGF